MSSSNTAARTAARDAAVVRALILWFRRSARSLPWRHRRSGYRSLVSEAMLQQTQVSRVIDRYQAFIRRFPTVADLARADEQAVLAAWQGLGYYRRARNLHAAARMIVDEFRGRVPRDVDALLTLPGVGRYTAGAIASIVYNRREPIVDGNVQRVLARLDADASLGCQPSALGSLAWTRAAELVQCADDPGAFNEGMMELGATICTPRSPSCDRCPLAKHCQANRRGIAHELPPAKPAATQRSVHHHTIIVHRGGRVLLEKRPSTGLWANMWQTPTIESDAPLRCADLASRLPVAVNAVSVIDSFVHHTSHRRITFHVHATTSRARKGMWRSLDDVSDLPMSNAHCRVLDLAREVMREPMNAAT